MQIGYIYVPKSTIVCETGKDEQDVMYYQEFL